MKLRARWLAVSAVFLVAGACSKYELSENATPDGGAEAGADAPASVDAPAANDAATADAAVDDDAGDGGALPFDAGPPCPYAVGCPCGSNCAQTVGTYPYKTPDYVANDGASLFIAARGSGLVRIALASGVATTVFRSALDDAGAPTGTVNRVFISPTLVGFVEVPTTGPTSVIRAAPRVGIGPIVTLVPAVTQSFQDFEKGTALSANRVYWVDSSRGVNSAALDGGSPLTFPGANADDIVFGGGSLFIADGSRNVQRRTATLAAVSVEPLFDIENSLATDGTSVAWATHATNGMALAPFSLDGGVFLQTDSHVYAVAFGDDGFVYYDTGDVTYRCRLPDCNGGPAAIIVDPNYSRLVAVTGGKAYYVTPDGPPFTLYGVPLHD